MLNEIRNRFHPLWRLRKLAIFRWIQQRLDPDFSTNIYETNVSVKLMRDFGIITNLRNLEKATRAIFKKILLNSKVDIFLDVGANIGIYSWMARKYCVEQTFMFEPDQTNCRLLLKTIINNRAKNIYLVPFAVSDRLGVTEYYPDNASGAAGSLVNHASNKSSLHCNYGMNDITSVPTIDLNHFSEYCEGKNVIIKIDVEGYEKTVLTGSMLLIEKVLPIIIIECNQENDTQMLEEIGYRKYSLGENHNYLMIHSTSQMLSLL
ncbi:S-adenosyl-L-methionine-dependent methyltransferase [Synechococcus sp. A15-62]|nr:S-adenosyl-L-methionine-dependent methyltransferase [Synechococcus sp. A15-62]